MNLFKKKTIKLSDKFKANYSFKKNIAHDSFVDWTIILVTFITCSLIFIVFGIINYQNITGRFEDASIAKVQNSVKIDNQLLNKVIKNYDSKAKEREGLQKNYTGLSDPSI